MKYIFILICTMTTIFNSCNSDVKELEEKPEKKIESEQLFEYYNLFTLKGIGEIKQPNVHYPYVSIKSLDDSIIISHHLDSTLFYTSTYIKVDSFLFRKYKLDLGIDHLLIEEYTRAKDIIAITYIPGTPSAAWSISVFSDSTLKTYGFSKGIEHGIDLNTALSYIDTLKMEVNRIVTFSNKGDNIEIVDDFKNLDTRVSSKKKYSVISFQKPLHWWLIYVWHSYSKSLDFFRFKLNKPSWHHNFER